MSGQWRGVVAVGLVLTVVGIWYVVRAVARELPPSLRGSVDGVVIAGRRVEALAGVLVFGMALTLLPAGPATAPRSGESAATGGPTATGPRSAAEGLAAGAVGPAPLPSTLAGRSGTEETGETPGEATATGAPAAGGPTTGATLTAPAAARQVPAPTVTGPVTDPATFGHFHNQSFFAVDPYGYVDQEFFLEGTAKAYAVGAPDAPYKTRVQVIRPTSADRFNGTVIVEWLNNSTGQDLAVQWLQLHETILREGYAWVGVSAQTESTTSLAAWDPARYGTLRNPGYWHMFDVYNQAIVAAMSPTGGVLGGLAADQVLATGASQSAVRLDEYLDFGVDADVQLVDGLLIERNVDTKADYATQRVPVVNIATEESTRPSASTKGPNWRLWQVAGGAHIDHYFVEFWRAQLRNNNQNHAAPSPGADRRLAEQVGTYGERPLATGAVCGGEGNTYPTRYVSALALTQLADWARGGPAAIDVPALATTAQAGPNGAAIDRDSVGNARGGFRSPVVDVPLVRYVGNSCGLSGQTLEAAAGYLAEAYGTREGYLGKLQAAIDKALTERRLLPTDAQDLWRRAQAAVVPR